MIDTRMPAPKVLRTTMPLPITPGINRKDTEPSHILPNVRFVRINTERVPDFVEWRPCYLVIVLVLIKRLIRFN